MSKHVSCTLLTLSWVIGLCGWGAPAPGEESAPATLSAAQEVPDGLSSAPRDVAHRATAPETFLSLEDARDFEDGLREGPGMRQLAGQALASVLVVVAVAVVSLLIARRFMPMGSGRGRGKTLSVLETSAIGPKKALHVVRVGARTYLVASGVNDVRLLADVTGDVDMVEEEPSIDADRHEHSFSGVLRQIVGSRTK